MAWVRGSVIDTGADLPAMPPLHAQVGLRWDRPAGASGRTWAETMFIWTDGQTRPGPGEHATPSWRRVDLRFGQALSRRWSVTVAVENLTDEAVQDHLSRVWQDLGSVSQPGRNVRVNARLVY